MPSISTYSLSPYKGEVKQQDLLHLLRRTLFGVGHKDLNYFRGKSLTACLDVLLKQSPERPPPLQDDPDWKDPMVPDGKTWVNASYQSEIADKSRRTALRAWWIGQLINRDYSLTEKMVLFWHNHFVTEMDIVKDSRYSYQYVVMLRKHALGNFKQLIKEGNTNVAMLVYLNGNANTKVAPNENYSRELMELFTLGKGKDVHYTEDDVKAAARVLSGWRDNKETIRAEFLPDLHDTDDKKFSSYFDSEVIKGRQGKEGALEIDALVEMLFKRRETAKFVCRNLYRWFVSAHIDEQIETRIIDPLAQVFIEHSFEIAPVLRTLLGSEHFFDPAFRGCLVKNPAEFFIGVTRQFDIVFPKSTVETHLCWAHYYFNIGGLSMSIGDPPSVAGWPAYYQAPKYHQWWINSYTLGFRMKITESLYLEEGTNCNGPKIKFDYLRFAAALEAPWDINKLLEQSLRLLCAVDISSAVKQKLKAILVKDLKSETHWADRWHHLKANPDDAEAMRDVSSRLRSFFGGIMNMPEYQMT
jgi:uncharacterized protein (DUF1800 family)